MLHIINKQREKYGDKFSPYLNPLLHWKKVEFSPLKLTHDFICSYILLTTVNILPSILYFTSFDHKPALQMVSKALEKSIKVHYSLSFLAFIYSIMACKMKILSQVE